MAIFLPAYENLSVRKCSMKRRYTTTATWRSIHHTECELSRGIENLGHTELLRGRRHIHLPPSPEVNALVMSVRARRDHGLDICSRDALFP